MVASLILCEGWPKARRSGTENREPDGGPSGTPENYFGQPGLPLALLRGLAPHPLRGHAGLKTTKGQEPSGRAGSRGSLRGRNPARAGVKG